MIFYKFRIGLSMIFQILGILFLAVAAGIAIGLFAVSAKVKP